MKKYIALLLLTVLSAGACASGSFDRYTGERTLTSAAIGAGSGALIGTAFHDPAAGALFGAGAGLLGGYLYDQYRKSQGETTRPYYGTSPSTTTPVPGATYYDQYGNPYVMPRSSY